MPIVIHRKTFLETGDFAASSAAERYLSDLGFSIGRRQGYALRGIMFGDYDIQKWRNLSDTDISELHGVMWGSGRNGPVRIKIYASAPLAARLALAKAEGVFSSSPDCGPDAFRKATGV